LVAERKQSVAELSGIINRANRLAASLTDFDLDKAKSDQAALAEEIDAAGREMARAQNEVTTAQQLSDSESQADEFAARFSALLDHGEAIGLQEGHCPLCDAVRSDAQFAASIAAARTRLSEGGMRVKAAADRLSAASEQAQAAALKLGQLQARHAELTAHMERVTTESEAILAAYVRHGLTAAISDPFEAQRQVLQKQDETNELEQALYILEASSAHDRVTSLESHIENLRELVEEETVKLAMAEKAVEVTRQIKNAAATVTNEVLTEQFNTVMPLLKELYRRLRPHTNWREIETDFGGKVRASLNFTVGEGKNPQFLFSSGQRRAAGLAFLLAIHLSRPWCRLESLWLDDPVQHVDDYRALNLVEVLSAIRRAGRQVIVAVEDQALADLLCRRLRSSEAQLGRRFELSTAINGSAVIERAIDIEPMPKEVLPYAEAS
jgi:DNA repair exonuclease SbcCD ATPase subunit